jgi:hypothetical protein
MPDTEKHSAVYDSLKRHADELTSTKRQIEHLMALEYSYSPRVYSTTSSATPTPNSDSYDMYILTALATAPTFGAPSGTPVQGRKLLIRIKDDGTARALTWNAIYRALGVDLPTTTTISKTMYIGFIYNSTDTKWDCVAFVEQA